MHENALALVVMNAAFQIHRGLGPDVAPLREAFSARTPTHLRLTPVIGVSFPGGAGQARARVLRGGSWNNQPRNVRSANRNRNAADNRNNNIGFRLASPPARSGVAAFTDAASVAAGDHEPASRPRRQASAE